MKFYLYCLYLVTSLGDIWCRRESYHAVAQSWVMSNSVPEFTKCCQWTPHSLHIMWLIWVSFDLGGSRVVLLVQFKDSWKSKQWKAFLAQWCQVASYFMYVLDIYFLERKKTYCLRGALFFKWSALHFSPIAANRLTNGAGCGVSGQSLERKKRYSQCTLFFQQSALHYRLFRSKYTSCVGHGGQVQDVEFHENHLNGRKDTTETVLCSTSKVYFIIDWSRPNLQVL